MTVHIVVTGGDGFIARTLLLRLLELGHDQVAILTRASSDDQWHEALAKADLVYHLAGVNRPPDPSLYAPGNAGLTATICDALCVAGRQATMVLTSSTQATLDNPYALSKRAAEQVVERYVARTGARGIVYRLPNVFGKWARPNYNSAVATFCHNIAHGLPITVHNDSAVLTLVFVDDVADALLALLPPSSLTGTQVVTPVFEVTVGEVVDSLREFAASRTSLAIPRVGTGFLRALYSTYVSYLPPDSFAYPLARHQDSRGAFSEILRTADSGQFSCFTVYPGATRGEHYHHTKTEKFLVVHGRALFGFRHIVTGEHWTIDAEGTKPHVVETVPGWAHNITNIGSDVMIVLVWANEVFSPARPDTIASKVVQ